LTWRNWLITEERGRGTGVVAQVQVHYEFVPPTQPLPLFPLGRSYGGHKPENDSVTAHCIKNIPWGNGRAFALTEDRVGLLSSHDSYCMIPKGRVGRPQRLTEDLGEGPHRRNLLMGR
jgi:hypothetical protein